MTTQKKTSAPVENFIRFSIGADEIAVADAAREADTKSVLSLKAMHDLVVTRHGVDLSALLPRKSDAAPLSNEQAAGRDFARRFHAVRRCGAECAAALADANVKGDTVLQRAGVTSTGTAYTPQAKRQIVQSIYNSDDWGLFVARLIKFGKAADIEKAVAAGEMTEDEAAQAGKRGTQTKNPLKTRALDAAATLCKILRTSAEKHDGSFDPKAGEKVAALISDIMSSNGFK